MPCVAVVAGAASIAEAGVAPLVAGVVVWDCLMLGGPALPSCKQPLTYLSIYHSHQHGCVSSVDESDLHGKTSLTDCIHRICVCW